MKVPDTYIDVNIAQIKIGDEAFINEEWVALQNDNEITFARRLTLKFRRKLKHLWISEIECDDKDKELILRFISIVEQSLQKNYGHPPSIKEVKKSPKKEERRSITPNYAIDDSYKDDAYWESKEFHG